MTDQRGEDEAPGLGVGEGSGEGTAQPGGDREAGMDEDAAAPGGDAPLSTPSTSRVGDREPGDTGDIGGTDRMTSSTGGLAGTSR